MVIGRAWGRGLGNGGVVWFVARMKGQKLLAHLLDVAFPVVLLTASVFHQYVDARCDKLAEVTGRVSSISRRSISFNRSACTIRTQNVTKHTLASSVVYRVDQKSRLLILSEYVNQSEKIWGMWDNRNSYRENEAWSDNFTWNILRHNCFMFKHSMTDGGQWNYCLAHAN